MRRSLAVIQSGCVQIGLWSRNTLVVGLPTRRNSDTHLGSRATGARVCSILNNLFPRAGLVNKAKGQPVPGKVAQALISRGHRSACDGCALYLAYNCRTLKKKKDLSSRMGPPTVLLKLLRWKGALLVGAGICHV